MHRLLDLRCEFAGRREHQRADADAAKLVLRRLALAQFVEHRQHEGGGLAGAGLRAAEQVVPFENERYGLGLYRGRGFVALLAHGLDNGRSQLEIFKVHSDAPVLGAWHVDPSPRHDEGPVGADRIKNGTRALGLVPSGC